MNRTSIVLALLLVALPAAANEPVQVRVARVEGLSRRALLGAIARAELGECQSTFIGGTLQAELVVEGGRPIVTFKRVHEELRPYTSCVERRLSRLRFTPSISGRARLAVRFPPLGLAP